MPDDVFQNYQDIWQNDDDEWSQDLFAVYPKYEFYTDRLRMDKIVKTSFDQINIPVFFDGDLEASESVVDFTVTCIDISTNLDSKTDTIAAEEQVDQQVNVVLKTGGSGINKVTIEVVTDTGSTTEKDFLVYAENIPIGDFSKQPADNFIIKVDFSNLMDLTETLDSQTIVVTAINTDSLVDRTSAVIGVSSLDTSDQAVILVVEAGVDAEHIKITVEVACTDQIQSVTKQFSRDIYMTIREK